MRYSIIDEQDLPSSMVFHPCRQYRVRFGPLLLCKQSLMARSEDFLVVALKIGCSFGGIGAREFIMKKNGIRIVHNSKAPLPQPRAIIRLLVISRLEALIETAGLFPDFS